MYYKTKSILKVAMVMAAASLAFLQFQGCSGGGGGGGTVSTGTLKLSITDKQTYDFKEVVISISEIRIVPAGMENSKDDNSGLPVVARFSPPMVIDVMKLQFIQQALGEVILPAGNYSQLRLILAENTASHSANYLVLNSGSQVPLEEELITPSAHTSGLKVKGPIVIKPGIINAVMIDFDPNTAINKNYHLNPTGIRLVQMSDVFSEFGSISGRVISSFEDWSSATVTVKSRGGVNDVDPIAAGKIFSSYTSGAWQAPFAAFVPGSTSVSYKTFVAATGFQLYSSSVVSVTNGLTTDLGTIPLVKIP